MSAAEAALTIMAVLAVIFAWVSVIGAIAPNMLDDPGFQLGSGVVCVVSFGYYRQCRIRSDGRKRIPLKGWRWRW